MLLLRAMPSRIAIFKLTCRAQRTFSRTGFRQQVSLQHQMITRVLQHLTLLLIASKTQRFQINQTTLILLAMKPSPLGVTRSPPCVTVTICREVAMAWLQSNLAQLFLPVAARYFPHSTITCSIAVLFLPILGAQTFVIATI